MSCIADEASVLMTGRLCTDSRRFWIGQFALVRKIRNVHDQFWVRIGRATVKCAAWPV